jgi:hypothetical protein
LNDIKINPLFQLWGEPYPSRGYNPALNDGINPFKKHPSFRYTGKYINYTLMTPEQIKLFKAHRCELSKKYNAKRRRGLGFIPINKPFKDSHGHHIDKECIVYIPEQLHTSISHNVWTGKGINDINAKTLDWLGIKPLTLAEIISLPQLTLTVKQYRNQSLNQTIPQ